MYYLIIWILIFLAVELICFWLYKESTGFKVTEYNIELDKAIEKSFTFVMLSDLHDTDTGEDNNKLLDEIDKISPDFVLMAGDMITSYKQFRYNSDVTFSFLNRLADKYKIYYSLGNHEHRYLFDEKKFPGKYDELVSFCEKHDIVLLDNEKTVLEFNNICIYGLTIPIEHYRRMVTKKLTTGYISTVLGNAEDNMVNILLAHNPDHFDDYAEWKADIVCAGHVHGGIVRLPWLGGVLSPQLKIFPKYDAGLFYKDKTVMVLGRGLGWHTIPIRIFNKAELIKVTVSGK